MTTARHKRILLIEPSSLTGSIIVSTARQLNLFPVYLVSSVRGAEQLLNQENFFAVIASLEEDRDAQHLIERVRNAHFPNVNPKVPIAVIASSINAALAMEMKVLDVRRVLIKPFKVRDVITTIQMLQQTG